MWTHYDAHTHAMSSLLVIIRAAAHPCQARGGAVEVALYGSAPPGTLYTRVDWCKRGVARGSRRVGVAARLQLKITKQFNYANTGEHSSDSDGKCLTNNA